MLSALICEFNLVIATPILVSSNINSGVHLYFLSMSHASHCCTWYCWKVNMIHLREEGSWFTQQTQKKKYKMQKRFQNNSQGIIVASYTYLYVEQLNNLLSSISQFHLLRMISVAIFPRGQNNFRKINYAEIKISFSFFLF